MSLSIPVGLAAREGQPDLSDFAATLDDMAGLGLGYVEIPAYAYDLVIAGRLLPARVAEFAAICEGRGHGFTIHGPLSINFMGPEAQLPRFLEATKAFIEICARIGAPHLVIHAGMMQPDERHDFENAAGRQRDCLHRAGEFAAEHAVTLCVENLFDFGPYAATPSIARLARELEAIGHDHVRATFDFSHGLIHATQHRYDFLAEARALAPFSKHLHLHDSFGIPDLPWVYASAEANAFGFGDLHLPQGWGSVPWAAIAAQCAFPPEAIAIHELNMRFWRDRHAAIDAARAFAAGLSHSAI
ncbi:sugar phosphate isomerase/epimerase family protein [Labrys monachus]|uniref:Sugar phosphate isomerase/epimerase n=1 Tax=Labrys monachus TaxID=217067 RepID=A0ABU0FCF1_9HYPH|nr:sugar phosphate isomerase/epimerase [Labrys monachus]MDQ0392293.1 sugar phosphate isomerase/epimerase [Labrys monachus]